MFQFIVVFVSLPYFTLPVELGLCLFSFCSIFRHLVLFFVDCLNLCDEIQVRHIVCTGHLHALNRLINMGMIWYKKNYCLLNKLTSLTDKIIVLKEIFVLLTYYYHFNGDFSLTISTDDTSSSRVNNVENLRQIY